MAGKLLKLYQFSDGYCYNSDTLFLYDFALNFIRSGKHKKILDIGAGCGILGLLLARDFHDSAAHVTLVEKNLQMASLAKINARPFAACTEVHGKDIFDSSFGACFDFILSNPPFYRQEILDSKNEKISTARNQRFMPLDLLCKKIKSFLKPHGHFILCYDAKELHHVLPALLAHQITPQTLRLVYPNKSKNASLALIQARFLAKGSLQILPPLLTHQSKDQKDNTPEVKSIYAKANTYSIKVHSSHLLTQG